MRRFLKLLLLAFVGTHLGYAQQLIADPEFDGGGIGVTAWGTSVGSGSTFATNLPNAAPPGTALSRSSGSGAVSGTLSTRTNASLVAGETYIFTIVVSSNEVLSASGTVGLQIRDLSNVIRATQSANLAGTQPTAQALSLVWTSTISTQANLLISLAGNNGGSTLVWTVSSADFRRVPELNAGGALPVLLLLGLVLLVAQDRRRFASGPVV